MSMIKSMSASELTSSCDSMEGVAQVHDVKNKNVKIEDNAAKSQTLDRFSRPSYAAQGEKRKKNFFASFRFSKRAFSRSRDEIEKAPQNPPSSPPPARSNIPSQRPPQSFRLPTSAEINRRQPYMHRVSSFMNQLASRVNVSSEDKQTSNQNKKLERSQTVGGNDLIPKYSGFVLYDGNVPGLMGIRNHGNTCFMNAVIQCLSHTDILAEYFVLDHYKSDLARSNRITAKKFGTKGEITEELAVLLKSLWTLRYGIQVSVNFKNIVEKYEPLYVGSNQHDAAEFLMFVLDKVHEDLNTASKRKYRKVKSSYGRPDDVVAAETLANHLRCNDSFVQAIFQAQFRSSLKCPHCLKESNTFDPYLFVSIPIPQKEFLSLFITVVYLNQQPKQVKLGLSIETTVTIKELRRALSNDCGINEEDLLLTEIDGEGFHRTFADNASVEMIAPSDPIYAIELNPSSIEVQDSAGFLLVTWINIVPTDSYKVRFGGVYQSQIARDISYPDLQKVLLKEMCSMVTMKTLLTEQQTEIFEILVSSGTQDMAILSKDLDLPLFDECIEEALSICHPNAGSPHVKFVLMWTPESKNKYIIDDVDHVDEHASVEELRNNIPQSPPVSLNECLQLHTSTEMLSCGDAWLCPTCNRKQQVLKRLTLWSAPQILVVHLKRFKQNSMNANSSKLTTAVEFPLTNFDISEHMATNTCINGTEMTTQLNKFGGGWSPWKRSKKGTAAMGGSVYDLYAVCEHHGKDLQGGHYTATCRNPTNNKWYTFDDFAFEEIYPEEVVTPNAYILFYQKRDDVLSPCIKEEDSIHWSSRIPRICIPLILKKFPFHGNDVKEGLVIETEETSEIVENGDVDSEESSSDTPEKICNEQVNHDEPIIDCEPKPSPPLDISKTLTNGNTHLSSSAPEARAVDDSSKVNDQPKRLESTPEVRIQPASEEVSRVYRTKALNAKKSDSPLTSQSEERIPITTQSEVNGFTESLKTEYVRSPKRLTESHIPQIITESSV